MLREFSLLIFISLIDWKIQTGTCYSSQKKLIESASSSQDRSPLFYAVLANNIADVRLLLASGVPLDIDQVGSETLLQIAVINSNIEMVELLLAYGANINAKGRYEYTPLIQAIRQVDLSQNPQTLAMLNYLLANDAVDINLIGGIYAPLHFAAIHNLADVVELLLAHDADVNFFDIKFKEHFYKYMPFFVHDHSRTIALLEEKQLQNKRWHDLRIAWLGAVDCHVRSHSD